MYKWLMIALAALAGCAADPAKKRPFLLGADISMLSRMEELAAVFKDDGRPGDLIEILKNHGGNCFRLRLFVNPDYRNAVVQDLPYTLKLARRIKEANAKLLLDLHYSDTWADPGKQIKPKAWKDLDFPALVNQVQDYTAEVMAAFKSEGILPEMVQVGNEITPGFLWPEGRLDGGSEEEKQKQWRRFAALLKAGIAGVRKPLDEKESVQIVIHIDQGARWETTEWFFTNLEKQEVDFDIIGLSFYPWWHGTMADLRENLHKTAARFQKDIFVVETAYPWRGRDEKWKDTETMAWPISPEGQRDFLAELIRTVRQTPDGRGLGVQWWYPEAIPTEGLFVWNNGGTALFDPEGNALPAVQAFENH